MVDRAECLCIVWLLYSSRMPIHSFACFMWLTSRALSFGNPCGGLEFWSLCIWPRFLLYKQFNRSQELLWLRREPLRSHVIQAKCFCEPPFLLLYNEENILPTVQDKLNSVCVQILFEAQSAVLSEYYPSCHHSVWHCFHGKARAALWQLDLQCSFQECICLKAVIGQEQHNLTQE